MRKSYNWWELYEIGEEVHLYFALIQVQSTELPSRDFGRGDELALCRSMASLWVGKPAP